MPTASDLAKFFTDGWSQVARAPFPFIVIIFVTWAAAKAFYSQASKVANDRRELAVEQMRAAEEERDKYKTLLSSEQQATGSRRPNIPKIHSAQWGVGGDDYRPVEILLQGYLNGSTPELRASVPFFGDPYKREHKHLVVQFSKSGTAAVETRTFREGDLIRLND
jgi:hypothetical protein